MKILDPFETYFSTTSASRSLKMTTRCHSVRSLRSPLFLSVHDSLVARYRLTIFKPSCVVPMSGSFPTFPTNCTQLKAQATLCSCFPLHGWLLTAILSDDNRQTMRVRLIN